jgi:lipopolysaccharide biosynthesis glycosyltransferase
MPTAIPNSRIDLAFGVDEAFLPQVGVVLASVAAHTAPERLRVWIASTESAPARFDVGWGGKTPGLEIHWLPIDHQAIAEAPTSAQISLASYYRLLIPALLPPEIHRYLYLDADLVIEKDLTELFHTDLGQAPAAAVVDASHPTRRLLGMRSTSRYFNAGVLLINRPVWLEQRVTKRALDLISRHPDQLAFHDQDTLNVLFDGIWLELPPQWNQQTGFWEQSAAQLGLDRASHDRLLRDPAIIHFTGRSKPWHFTNDHPLRKRYWNYRALAGMSTEPPRPKSWGEILRRGIKQLTPYRHRELARHLESRFLEPLYASWRHLQSQITANPQQPPSTAPRTTHSE